jgi:hypothetical protein
MNHPNLTQAMAERDTGIRRAIDHAERVEPSWGDMALDQIRAYAALHKEFISEECTDWAAARGFASPTDPRAWGAPFKVAARLGIIRKVGYGVSKRRHLSPCPLWASAVCGA